MRLRSLTAALALVALVAPLGPLGPHGPLARGLAHATPAVDLAAARDAVRLGDYARAIPLLSALLYPEASLSRTDDLVEAHLLLGVAHLEQGNRGEARQEFEEALLLSPNVTLDPLLFSQAAIEAFNDKRADFLDRAKKDAEARRLAEERDRLRKALDNLVVIEKRSYYVNFIPFGAGQFQNEHNGKGVFFFVSQLALGGTSAGIYAWQVSTFGFGGRVPSDRVDTVRRAQQVQIATGVLCLALMGWGIIDALIYYQPTIQRKSVDESLLPKQVTSGRGADSVLLSPPARSGGGGVGAVRLLPTATPDGGGLVLSWEY